MISARKFSGLPRKLTSTSKKAKPPSRKQSNWIERRGLVNENTAPVPNHGETALIFISYSRSDRAHAERIGEELRRRGHEVSRDLDDILPTEEWRTRIE